MTTIYDQLLDERYDHPNSTRRNPVNLLDDIRAEIGRAVTWTEDELRAKLPTVAKLADAADAVASSNAAQAVLAAVLSPADEAWIVGLVQRLDQRVDAAAGEPGPAADGENLHAGEIPADPADPGVPVPAGPLVGGQA
jgi:hypothetical protein